MKQYLKMQNARQQKNNTGISVKKLSGNKKKTEDIFLCPYCGQKSDLVWVHGHYQCSNCKTVIVSCCNGDRDNYEL
ncbi:MAG TPA: hypothetical protein PKA90_03680 [Ignavibacteria bacterium]|nr:hypothetical protein [Ignavibacteria bacterium]